MMPTVKLMDCDDLEEGFSIAMQFMNDAKNDRHVGAYHLCGFRVGLNIYGAYWTTRGKSTLVVRGSA